MNTSVSHPHPPRPTRLASARPQASRWRALGLGSAVCASALLALTACTTKPAPLATDDGTVAVSLAFDGRFAGRSFDCTGVFEGVGSSGASVTVADYRLFVSHVRLLDANGTETPLTLEDDGRWQHDGIALLDFENGTAGCVNGTPETNTAIRGRVPAGDYTGIAFDVGVPFERNHADPTLAASPLNLTAMFWNWRGGYRFMRVDLASVDDGGDRAMMPEGAMSTEHGATEKTRGGAVDRDEMAQTHGEGDMHGMAKAPEVADERGKTTTQAMSGVHGMTEMHEPATADGGGGHAGGAHGAGGGWALHVGSSGCVAPSPTSVPERCAAPNRVEVVFEEFEPGADTIVIDPARVLAEVDVGSNTPGTSPGCMSAADDPECGPVFTGLGLDGSGASQVLATVRR